MVTRRSQGSCKAASKLSGHVAQGNRRIAPVSRPQQPQGPLARTHGGSCCIDGIDPAQQQRGQHATIGMAAGAEIEVI